MNNLDERQYTLEESVKKLESVNKKLAKLTLEKEELTKIIIAALGHEKAGQATYQVNEYKVTCKTPSIYSLDTKAWKEGDVYLPAEFNPIKESVSYTVDKKLYDDYFNLAPESVRESLVRLVTIKPGKVGVTLGSI